MFHIFFFPFFFFSLCINQKLNSYLQLNHTIISFTEGIKDMNSIHNQSNYAYLSIQNCNENNHIFDRDHLYSQLDFGIRNGIMEEKKKFLSKTVSIIHKILLKRLKTMEDASSKKLKVKDEEINELERMNYMLLEQMKNLEFETNEEIFGLKRLNYMLSEQLKNAELENQAWKLVVQNYESNVAALKQTVENLLAMKENDKDDCESCDDNYSANYSGEECRFGDERCLNCEKGVPSVLFLPCKHLCLCMVCGPAIHFCPICNCAKSGSVNFNLL